MAIVIDNLSLTRLSQVHDRLLSPGRAAWLVQAVNVPCRWGPADKGRSWIARYNAARYIVLLMIRSFADPETATI